MPLITNRIIRKEARRVAQAKKHGEMRNAEVRGQIAFRSGEPYKVPEDEKYPTEWRRGWRWTRDAVKNPHSWLRKKMLEAGEINPYC